MGNKFLKYCTDTSLHATIILPGGCNANCFFCYDISANVNNPNYIEDLSRVIDKIPVEARKLAVTGMETTISPYFKDLLPLAEQYRENGRFDFNFLNTNGFMLEKYADRIGKSFDSINISRHAAFDEDNYKIFDTNTVPNIEKLKFLISEMNLDSGVNINTVVTDDMSNYKIMKKIFEMTEVCKYIGAQSLTIRFEATDVLRKEPLIPELNKYETLQYNANPGCRFWLKEINGLYVVLKHVTKDPTNYSNWNYGYIIQRNLEVTRDWAGEKKHSLLLTK